MHDGFDVDKVAASFAEDGVTLVSLVATQLIRLLEADVDLTAPGAIVMGGGPVPFEAIEEATGRGATVIQVYGMTETTSQVTLLETADAERKAGSAGRALLGAEVTHRGRRDPRSRTRGRARQPRPMTAGFTPGISAPSTPRGTCGLTGARTT